MTTPIHFIVDVTGYYDTNSGGGLLFTPLASPVRFLDTRPGNPACYGGGGPDRGGSSYTDPVSAPCNGKVNVPSNAGAVVGNATVVADAGAGPGYLTLFPAGAILPTVSNVNYVPGQVVPNAFIVGVANFTFSNGSVYKTFMDYPSTTIDIILDISGYFSDGTSTSSQPTNAKGNTSFDEHVPHR